MSEERRNAELAYKGQFPDRVYGWREEDPKVLAGIEQTLMERRGYISREPRGEEAVFIVSGGLDSSTAMDLVMREWEMKQLYPLFVRRSARATKYEEESAKFFVDFYQQRYPGQIADLQVVETEVPPLAFKHYAEKDRLNKLGHPGRNSVLQTMGVQYANFLRSNVAPELHNVLTATVGDDSFPHSSLAALRAENLLTCVDTGDWNWLVTSPLIDTQYPGRPLFKKNLIQYAMAYGIPLEKTRTCIEGGALPDGTCGECEERLHAFRELGIEDPAEYQPHQ